MKRGFTLLEVLFVIVIVAILGYVLLQSYITMMRISFRIQHEKYLAEQALLLSQTLQNLADTTTIDYARYASEFGTSYLAMHSGLVNILYLVDEWGTGIRIGFTGDCSPTTYQTGGICAVFIQKGQDIQSLLTHTGKVHVHFPYFKIIPYASLAQYLQDPSLCPIALGACIHHPGFWLLAELVHPRIGKAWEVHIRLPFTAFFTTQYRTHASLLTGQY